MKMKKLLNGILAPALVLSMMTGCGNTAATDTQQPVSSEVTENAADTAEETETEETATEEATAEETTAEEATDENETVANQLLVDLTGTYQELWPVILDEQYEQIWLDDCKPLVGEENAQAAYEKLASMVTGEIYGEEAVEAYADGKELFAHTYHYIGMEEIRGLYEYESDDADSGEFTYFCIAPDTSATTYHIELRYGSNLNALGQYDAGAYAYWLGAGISTEYDQAMVENCIELFCTENLSEQ